MRVDEIHAFLARQVVQRIHTCPETLVLDPDQVLMLQQPRQRNVLNRVRNYVNKRQNMFLVDRVVDMVCRVHNGVHFVGTRSCRQYVSRCTVIAHQHIVSSHVFGELDCPIVQQYLCRRVKTFTEPDGNAQQA